MPSNGTGGIQVHALYEWVGMKSLVLSFIAIHLLRGLWQLHLVFFWTCV